MSDGLVLDGPEPGEPVPDDTRFPLPFCDDPPSTEIGVIVMGLPAEQLLAGLGMAALAEDPATVTLLIDRVRHGGTAELNADRLVAAGLDRWRTVQPALATAGPRDDQAPLRQRWAKAYQALAQCQLGPTGAASFIYLTSCWLRAAEVEAYAGRGQ